MNKPKDRGKDFYVPCDDCKFEEDSSDCKKCEFDQVLDDFIDLETRLEQARERLVTVSKHSAKTEELIMIEANEKVVALETERDQLKAENERLRNAQAITDEAWSITITENAMIKAELDELKAENERLRKEG